MCANVILKSEEQHMMDVIIQAFFTCLEPINLLAMLLSVSLGIVVGMLPGFGAATGLVLVLPLTYGFDPATAFITLTGIYLGAEYGGSISAILVNTPGTAAAVVTAFDGFPLARRGHAREALLISNIASFCGGMFGGVVMLFCIPILGRFVLKFGAGEIFILASLGLLLVGSISRGNVIKGIASAALGLFFTLFGADSVNGVSRFDFDVPILIGGLPIIGGMLAMFAVPQMLSLVLGESEQQKQIEVNGKGVMANFSLFCQIFRSLFSRMKMLILRSSLIGVLIGIVPGVGAAVASMAAYTSAKKYSAEPEQFGKGAVEGIAAPESANNAIVGGSLIPVISLGIPGSPAAAIYMGAIFLHGMTPGPNFMVKEADLVYLIIFAIFFCSVVQMLLGAVTIGSMANILKLSVSRLFPIVISVCCIGAYVSRSQNFDISFFIFLGIVAFFAIKMDLNMGAVVLGAFLGSTMEVNLLEGLTIASALGGIVPYLATRKIACGMLALLAVYIVWKLVSLYRAYSCRDGRGECVAGVGAWSGYRGWDLGFSILFLCVIAYFFNMAQQYPETSRLFPQVVLSVMGICMIVNIIKCLFFGKFYYEKPSPFARLNIGRTACMMLLLVLYLCGIIYIGFYVASAMFFVVASVIIEGWQHAAKSMYQKIKESLIFIVIGIPAMWVVFTILFKVNLPTGLLF